MKVLALVLLCAKLMQARVSLWSILLRIRSPSGILERLEVDDSMNISDFKTVLKAKGFNPLSSVLKFKQQNLTEDSVVLNSLQLVPGDIFEIKDDTLVTSHKSNATKSTLNKPKGPQPKKATGPTSLAELKRMKASLVKISNQKLSQETTVSIPTTIGKLLKEVGSKGGVTILFGHFNNHTKTNALSIDIKAGYELVSSDLNQYLYSDAQELMSLPLMPRLLKLSKLLGLQVVGCAIGSTNDSENAMWSSAHVFMPLQLRNISSSPANFVVVSTRPVKAKAAGRHSKPTSTRTATSVASPAAEDISIEAFLLSKQAVELHKRGILSTYHLTLESSRSESVVLQGEVLVQSDQVSSVDPLLFAIPVPLAKSNTTEKPVKRTFPTKKAVQIDALDHLFLKDSELKTLGDAAKVTKYLYKVLSKLAKKKWPKAQLKDFNLLLSLQDVVEGSTFKLLCEALVDSESATLPQQLYVALDMAKEALNDEETED